MHQECIYFRESDAHTHKTYKPLMSPKNKAAVPYKVPFGTPFLPKISGNVALVLHIYSNFNLKKKFILPVTHTERAHAQSPLILHHNILNRNGEVSETF